MNTSDDQIAVLSPCSDLFQVQSRRFDSVVTQIIFVEPINAIAVISHRDQEFAKKICLPYFSADSLKFIGSVDFVTEHNCLKIAPEFVPESGGLFAQVDTTLTYLIVPERSRAGVKFNLKKLYVALDPPFHEWRKNPNMTKQLAYSPKLDLLFYLDAQNQVKIKQRAAVDEKDPSHVWYTDL